MKNLTSNDLTLDQFREATFTLLRQEYLGNPATDSIIEAEADGDMLNDLYEEGLTVENAVNELVAEYREFNGLDRA